MKISYLLTLGIALGAYSQINLAGEIADTYTTGDTLTATKLNNIKSAVNDNDSSIRGHANGISKNLVDIDILKNKIAGLPGVFSVSAVVATSSDSSCPTAVRNTNNTLSGRIGRAADSVNCGPTHTIHAPVSLPDGATVTALRCTLYDANPNEATLCALNTDTRRVMVAASTLRSDSSGLQERTSTRINTPAVIDNSTTGYYVSFEVNGNAQTTIIPIRAVIEYTRP